MKRILFGLIVIVTMIWFFTLVPSTAADKAKFIGDEKHGIDDDTRAQNVRQALTGLNYSRENYTAIEPSPGESYNKSATRVFAPNETIYLIDRFYIATVGSYNRYYFITDVVGTLVAVDTQAFTISATGNYWSKNTIIFYAVGSYVYHSVTLGPGEWISSQQFSFIVE